MAESINLSKFDPEAHPQGVYEAFCDFIEQFAYEYDAVAKDPPKDATDAVAWIESNKRKVFLGKYSSRTLQKEYEDATTETQRLTMKFSDMVKILKTRFKATANTTLANFRFHKISQNEGESFDAFSIRVKREALNCDFKCASDDCTVWDTIVRDQIVIGTRNDEIRRHALKEQWNLSTVLLQGRSLESADLGASIIKKEEDPEGSVNRTRPGKYSKKYRKEFKAKDSKKEKARCLTCSSQKCAGKKHCPAHKMTCFECNEKGHFRGAPACPKLHKMKRSKSESRRLEESDSETSSSTNETSQSESSDSDSDRKVNFIKSAKHITKIRRMRRAEKKRKTKRESPRYEVEVIIKETKIKAFADTGADICIMSKKNAEELNLPIKRTRMKIKPYGSKRVKCCGEYIGTIMFGENVTNASVYILDQDVETLLSGRVSEDLNIIQFNDEPIRKVETASTPEKAEFVNSYPEVFSDKIGTLKGHKVKIHIDPEVKPVAQPSRPVPFHLRSKFERELKKMEEDGIIEEHEGPAPWTSNVVLAPKEEGQMRITVDMRHPNKAIHATNIPIPRVEEVKAKLAGAKYFSKLDFKSAFHQLEIEEESRYMTVFHAGHRLMRYRRLTMGTKPATGELNKALSPIFQDIKEAHIIHDDLVIATESKERHEEVLHECLRRIRDRGMTLNIKKCYLIQTEIPFWGIIINSEGVSPDPEKVQALKLASRPKNKEELLSFLCMVQSNKEFITSISKKSEHLRKLTKKNAQFRWDSRCEKEFKLLKKEFSEDILMRHYDPDMKTFISVDAHRSGLSAILQQGDSIENAKPVYIASRATTPVEAKYPQLDLEALAIDYALRRFRFYLVGGPKVEVITDHKPLVSIFSNLRSGSIRTDRIKLRHQDIDFQVTWRKGKDNPADFLSRHAVPLEKLPRYIRKETKEFEKTIWFIQFSPYTEAISMDRIIHMTKNDLVLCKLMESIQKGYIHKSDRELKPYQKVFDKLTISDEGLILKEDRIVLPAKLHGDALTKAHQGSHPGINSLKRRLRAHFWFPSLNEEAERLVKNCNECLLFSPKYTKEPIASQKVPEKAWSKVSIDLFGPMPNKRHVLVVTDNMSRFPAAKIVPSTDAKSVIPALDQIYCDYGQPESHRTDNGPPFNSADFERFNNENGIEHIKTFPYHPQANPAECFMKPLGKTMKAAAYNKKDQEKALNTLLSNYRATPHNSTNIAPGAIMFRHGYTKDFPRTEISDKKINEGRNLDESKKEARKEKVNSSRHRSKCEVGDTVLIKNNCKSKFQPLFGPTEYEVIEKKDGGVIAVSRGDNTSARRHLDDVKQVPRTIPSEVEPENPFNTHPIVTPQADESSEDPSPEEEADTALAGQEPLRRSKRKKYANPKFDDYVL